MKNYGRLIGGGAGARVPLNTPLTFSQPASTDCTALLANYIWPSGFLCCRPDGLELTTDWVSQSVCWFWCFSVHC